MSNSIKAFVACGLVMALCVAASFGQSSHYDVNNMDTKASACTDFYQYANGGWLAANPIPPAYPAWGLANILNEKNRDVLHEILEAAAKNSSVSKGSNEQKVGDYYA
ncbi:MAG TPA: M13 family metallopeptidase N-terminal domain-containing protein, partial [Pyrinomonadaceae bacterium]|nr:M13 family metallopeptidase N-terminal domain-containing protein [Pyrinomonadaceae bacterium]